MERKTMYYLKGSKKAKEKNISITYDYEDTREREDKKNIASELESGLCIVNDKTYPPKLTSKKEIPEAEMESTKLKVVEAVELNEIDKLKIEKSLYKKIAILFAEKRNPNTSNVLLWLYGTNAGLYIINVILDLANGKTGSAWLHGICVLCWVLNLSLNIKTNPKKAYEYLKLSSISDTEREELNRIIKEKNVEQLVNNCERPEDIGYYSSSYENIKKLCK